MSLNKVFLMGNLTRDPEQKQIRDGISLCKFGLAVNRRFRTAAGEDREDVCFVDVAAWRGLGDNCARYLSKGRKVFVEGRLKFDHWQSDKGERRSRITIEAEDVRFLDGPRGAGKGDARGDAGSGGGSGSARGQANLTSGPAFPGDVTRAQDPAGQDGPEGDPPF